MDWLILLASAACGALVAWLYFRARDTAFRAQLAGLDAQLAATRTALDAASVERDTLRLRTAERETLAAGLAATLESERKAAAEKLAVLQDAQARLSDAFKALSSDALKSNNEQFLRLAQSHLAQFQEGARGDLEKRQQAIDSLVKPLRETLDKVDVRIGELEKTRVSAYSALSEQLKSLASAQGTLQIETTRLATALSGTRTAGTWGELQLRRVVELAGMVEHCDFSEQTAASDRSRPDLVVRLPRGQIIAVDAKAPTDAFREAAVASDPALRALKLTEHASKVRGHIDALAARAYWEQFTPSPEFVVLFLPGDQFLAAALEADPAIVDRGINSRVLLATPSTLVALLKAAAYGWRQEAMSRNAEEIAKLGRELYDRVAVFGEHLEKTGRGLEQATSAYNKAVGSFESSLLSGARKFVELGARGAKDLPEFGGVETAVRDLTRRG
ncbi:MAG TPA: DNA recombination protein RmuC [Opitutaceae bacterium]|nr:DNA recombination protein RmuC [Opitutaceae bacterium]